MRIRQLGPVTFALVALMPAVSLADAQGQQIIKRWAGADRCSQQAFRAFPDYTAESLAKRDQAYKQCLAGGNLPPRDIPPPNRP